MAAERRDRAAVFSICSRNVPPTYTVLYVIPIGQPTGAMQAKWGGANAAVAHWIWEIGPLPYMPGLMEFSDNEPAVPAVTEHSKKEEDVPTRPFDHGMAASHSTTSYPSFPQPRGGSIMSPGGLNFRVRDGNGWNPSGVATGNLASGLRTEC